MNPHPALEKSVNWLLNDSLQAGVLVLLVLLVQWIFRRQLTSRWRFALWWAVIARLVLPFGPESAVSVFNYFRPAVVLEGPRYFAPLSQNNHSVRIAEPSQRADVSPSQDQPANAENNPAQIHTTTAPPSGISGEAAAPHVSSLPQIPHPSLTFNDYLIPGLAGLWFTGVAALSICVAAQVIRFRRKLQATDVPDHSGLRPLLEDSMRELNVSRRIELIETDAVTSPALFGLFKLRLLLPRGLAEKFTPRELRYIFLHELAHVKRGDLWLNWLVTALQIVHWFNPIVWLGFARLRTDRELACDEIALLRAGEGTGTSYGETIIKLLEGLSRPKTIPGLVGILEDKKQMRRRISMIANFRRPGRWSALAIILLTAVALAALTDAQTEKTVARPGAAPDQDLTSAATNVGVVRPDLLGEVHDKDGAPLPATVFISTAAPKTGTSTFCPSCYADCRKSAKADAQGSFKIESLDPQLTFRILVVAKGYKPKFVEKIDPAKAAAKVELEKMERTDAKPDSSVHGRVVDAKGAPVDGAVVEMVGVWRNEGGGWGAIPGVDPLAVTDERGEFLLTARDPFDGMDIKITARTFADKNFTHVASGGKQHDLLMTEGAILKGRVLANGKTLRGVKVGVSGVERQAGQYIGNFEIGTDSEGRFAFLNLPSNEDYWIYGIMETMKESGAIPIRKIHSAKDGETSDIGDLIVGPAHRLAGKVALSDGESVPPKTRLLVSREDAWDSMQLTLDTDGNFDTLGIPAETISLSARVKGYRISGQNASLDPMNLRMVGKMDRDVTNLVLLLEKGADLPRNYNVVGPETDWPQNRPLRGAEGAADHSREWTISGRVLDADTKEPIQNFHVIPGQSDQFDHVKWDLIHSFDGTNGAYVTHVSKRNSQPILKAEAKGYLPGVLFLVGHDSTEADFNLKRGAGPSGVVVLPSGKPAVDVTLVQLDQSYNQVQLSSQGELKPYWNTTDAAGHFSFKPEWGTKFAAAASSNGFTVVAIESLATNSTVTLQPYGRVTGTLKRTSRPGADEQLILMFSDSEKFSGINLNQRCASDAQGRFVFDRVPAGHLRIYSMGVAGEERRSGQASTELKEFELKPGQTLEVNIEVPDRPSANEVSNYEQPKIKRIAGAELKGIVLSPNGKPAADAQVALQVEGQYLVLGRAAFEGDQMLREGLIVRTDADGHFTVPDCEGAKFLMALNEEGFAKLSVEDFKASPQLALQKWGRIEGSLRVHGRPATNEWISVGFKNSAAFQIFYQQKAFEAKTDDQGRFAMTFVPPAEHSVSRRIPMNEHSWSTYTLGQVDVKPGETAWANFAPSGRIVIGKVDLGTNEVDFKYDRPLIRTPMSKWTKQFRELKTDEERKAFSQTDEAKAVMKNQRTYVAQISADGSIRAEDIPPGKYEIEIQPHGPPQMLSAQARNTFTQFVSRTEVVVPEAKSENDDSPVDLGTVALEKFTWTLPQWRSAK